MNGIKIERFGLLIDITFWYVGDVLSINNPNLSILIPFIYPKEIEIKGM
jgi:hypothetical protein